MTGIDPAAAIPDSTLARAITEYIRDTETDLLFNHSSRVYHFGALAGVQRGLTFDRELLYAGAMSASRLTGHLPPGISCAATAFRKRMPIRSGQRSHSTPPRACRSICIPSWLS
jgi:hypothetical protein